MNDFSHTTNAHPAYIEALYQSYRKDPESVDESWRQFFLGYDFAADRKAEDGAVGGAPVQSLTKEFGVMSIIHGFRDRGHLLSTTNPIRQRLDRQPRLDLNDYGLEDADLHKPFNAGHELGLGQATLQQILDHLRVVYCGTIGFEFSHIEDRNRRMWLRDRIENRPLSADYGFSPEKKQRILEHPFLRISFTPNTSAKRGSLLKAEKQPSPPLMPSSIRPQTIKWRKWSLAWHTAAG
jgi:2-oxoglutarate dehydrogenase E1 component